MLDCSLDKTRTRYFDSRRQRRLREPCQLEESEELDKRRQEAGLNPGVRRQMASLRDRHVEVLGEKRSHGKSSTVFHKYYDYVADRARA